ncbi:hypothetical protein [Francisella adeliensis]|uniref:Uncharacterized protein n=1 Tax=Francisella adeliensis TaxID=2007306 RepID=A0A2Z4XXR9_9GAMM|nr:hypothetical protein [Francisella adeliensis]AXA33252.1 hypothetical protein CDH04_01910 [Francisella adeliensis]MBK2085026.1 hypothetical protein [Francisella adeliensis]MBK2096983.1 hypothetical protein [Francisella adeliensis]QIW11478.1 hypothetical protein FZC43_01915 [Francisella adeliensis]QIW13353.1 hypothetical protein FZC44_01915 [Francisella adeliensis]
MCETQYSLMIADDFIRLILTFFLCSSCVILYFIVVKRKVWDIPFWFCLVGFLSSLAIYGHIVQHIFLQNTFSYDGFISGAAIITILGLLFSKRRYIAFSSTVFSKDSPILFATFIVFGLIYLSTVDYDADCVANVYQLSIDILHIYVYPLLLLFTISAFLYRFTICISAFAICMALSIVHNIVFMFRALTFQHSYNVLVEEMICSSISIVLSVFAILVLTKTKRYIRKERNDSSRN